MYSVGVKTAGSNPFGILFFTLFNLPLLKLTYVRVLIVNLPQIDQNTIKWLNWSSTSLWMEDVGDMRGFQSLKEEIGELRERVDWGYTRIEELMRAMGYLDEKHTRLICNQTMRLSVKWFRVRLVERRIEKVRQEIFDLRGEVLRW